jgi:AraC-like DNA-binding protein
MAEKLFFDKPASPAIASLAACLLEELGPQRTQLSAIAASYDANSFVQLYREAIFLLELRIAAGGGHPPMLHSEIELLCRCLLSCATLEEAIHCTVDFWSMLHPRGGTLMLQRRGAAALFRIDSLRHQRSPATCLVDLTGLLFFIQLFGWLIGEPLRPRAVALSYPYYKNLAPFLGLFDAPVYTGAALHRIEFDAQLLARPVLPQPAELTQFIAAFPYSVIGSIPGAPPLSCQVRACLEAALARGETLPQPKALAHLLGISETTLRRHLRAEGISYNNLRDACLQETAKRYLRDTSWDLEQIAGRLGFSERSAFRRAFRRWTGFSPSIFRSDNALEI